MVDVMGLDTIKREIKKRKPVLKSEYGVKSIGIFGSAARGQLKRTSDVDIMIELERPMGMFRFIDLEDYLSRAVGRKVDLVTRKAIKSVVKNSILKETVFV